ncbi:MAG: hypothetical protein CMJ64_01995 [Planctomycetaceae bacterium]|nr:hypothetical protein [Planctomycetaceae bacterium]
MWSLRASDIYQGGETEPFVADRAVPTAFASLDTKFPKNYSHVVALNVHAHLSLPYYFYCETEPKPGEETRRTGVKESANRLKILCRCNLPHQEMSSFFAAAANGRPSENLPRGH